MVLDREDIISAEGRRILKIQCLLGYLPLTYVICFYYGNLVSKLRCCKLILQIRYLFTLILGQKHHRPTSMVATIHVAIGILLFPLLAIAILVGCLF